jgi:hypothetical protein
VQFELDAPANDIIAMNLTIAAVDRWLENSPENQSGQVVGSEIGAMYRAIHTVVDEVSPEQPDDEDDEDDEEDDEALVGVVRGRAG